MGLIGPGQHIDVIHRHPPPATAAAVTGMSRNARARRNATWAVVVDVAASRASRAPADRDPSERHTPPSQRANGPAVTPARRCPAPARDGP